VYGLGGIGKSEPALQYALRNTGHYHLTWWIDADSPAQIQEGLADLARAITAGVHSVAAGQATVEEAVSWAVSWLAAHPGWLIIFDNVEQPTDIEPMLGRLTGGHVLITTRRAIGWHGLCATVGLEVLDPLAAEHLLAGLIGPDRPAPSGELAALAEELGQPPLALTQAGPHSRHDPGTLPPLAPPGSGSAARRRGGRSRPGPGHGPGLGANSQPDHRARPAGPTPAPATSLLRPPITCPSTSCTACLGPEHPDTLSSRANLARWTSRVDSGG
jgi:hypothetical protein